MTVAEGVAPRAPRSGWRRLRRAASILAVVLLLLVAGAAYVLSLPQFGGKLRGERLARAQANPQYRDGRFVNPLPAAPARTAGERGRLFTGQFFGDEVSEPPAPIPLLPVAAAAVERRAAAPALRAFWIGHASVYVEIDGVRLLVDPIFSDYASPFEFGPRRFHPPPIALADLPRIDAVLITHDHYDHLDMRPVQQLARAGTGSSFRWASAHTSSAGAWPRRRSARWSGGRSMHCAACASSPRRRATTRVAGFGSKRHAMDLVDGDRRAPSLLCQRRHRLLGPLSRDRRTLRPVRPQLRQDRRLRPRRFRGRHPHERGRRRARAPRSARAAAVSRCTGRRSISPSTHGTNRSAARLRKREPAAPSC